MVWIYFYLICSFIRKLSKACVGISSGAHQYNATEITGSSSVDPATNTQIVTTFQIGILLEQMDSFEILYKEITRNVQKVRIDNFFIIFFTAFVSWKFLSILLKFC